MVTAVFYPHGSAILHFNCPGWASGRTLAATNAVFIWIEFRCFPGSVVHRIQGCRLRLFQKAAICSNKPPQLDAPFYLFQLFICGCKDRLFLFLRGHIIKEYIIIRHLYRINTAKDCPSLCKVLFQQITCTGDRSATGNHRINIRRFCRKTNLLHKRANRIRNTVKINRKHKTYAFVIINCICIRPVPPGVCHRNQLFAIVQQLLCRIFTVSGTGKIKNHVAVPFPAFIFITAKRSINRRIDKRNSPLLFSYNKRGLLFTLII